MNLKILKKNYFLNINSIKNLKISDYSLPALDDIKIIFYFSVFYGLSFSTVLKVLIKMGIHPDMNISYVPLHKIHEIVLFLDSYILSKREFYIKDGVSLAKLQFFINYKGSRQLKGLPSRGQRTSTNAKSCRSLIFHRKILNLVEYFSLDDE